jgi:hypothetical protein
MRSLNFGITAHSTTPSANWPLVAIVTYTLLE